MVDRRTEDMASLELILNRSFGGVLYPSDSEDNLDVPDDCTAEQIFSESDVLRLQPFTCPSRQYIQEMPVAQKVDSELLQYISAHPYYVHSMVYTSHNDLLQRLLDSRPYNLLSILNEKDHRGNSPLLLAVKLAARGSGHMQVIHTLLEHGADPNLKDAVGWSALDEAVVKGDVELTGVIFDFMHKAKLERVVLEKKKAVRGLELLPDFYMEIKWEFDSKVIPFVSKLAPHDTCKLWKSGSNLRLDTTLVGWKNLRAKRRNISLLFHGKKTKAPFDLMVVNHSRELIVNPLEEVDEEERKAILGDIMKTDPIQGEVSFKNSTVKECLGWTGKPVLSRVAHWNCRKYEIQLNTLVEYKKRGFACLNLTESDYFRDSAGQAQFPEYSVVHHNPDEAETEENEGQEEEGRRAIQRKSKVNCWATHDFPITLKQFLPVLELLSSGHSSLSRLHNFLASNALSRYFPEDYFPVKVELPLNMTIKAVVTFLRCDLVQKPEKSLFAVPNYKVESRRVAQKTLTCPRKRMLLANLVV